MEYVASKTIRIPALLLLILAGAGFAWQAEDSGNRATVTTDMGLDWIVSEMGRVRPAATCGPAAYLAVDAGKSYRPVKEVNAFFSVWATGYSSTPDQTDDTPFITASNSPVRSGIVALSRDLLREFTPHAPFGFGDEIVIPGVGTFVVEDTMNRRWRGRVDIWFPTRALAKQWGVKRVRLVPV